MVFLLTISACARRAAPPAPPAAAEPPTTPPTAAAPAAEELARGAVASLGGQRAVTGLRFLRFDFIEERSGKIAARRSHWWDRHTGRYRLDLFVEGQPVTMLMNVKTGEGTAYARHRPMDAARQGPLVTEAMRLHRQDAAWLLSGGWLAEGSTQREFQGVTRLGDRYVYKLAATFPAERTPSARDRYWFYLDPASGRPYAWAIVQEGLNRQPETYRWTQWQSVGKASLPARFEQIGGRRVIRLEEVSIFADVGESIFVIP